MFWIGRSQKDCVVSPPTPYVGRVTFQPGKLLAEGEILEAREDPRAMLQGDGCSGMLRDRGWGWLEVGDCKQ